LQRSERCLHPQQFVAHGENHAAMIDTAILPAFTPATSSISAKAQVRGIARIGVIAAPPLVDASDRRIDFGWSGVDALVKDNDKRIVRGTIDFTVRGRSEQEQQYCERKYGRTHL